MQFWASSRRNDAWFKGESRRRDREPAVLSKGTSLWIPATRRRCRKRVELLRFHCRSKWTTRRRRACAISEVPLALRSSRPGEIAVIMYRRANTFSRSSDRWAASRGLSTQERFHPAEMGNRCCLLVCVGSESDRHLNLSYHGLFLLGS